MKSKDAAKIASYGALLLGVAKLVIFIVTGSFVVAVSAWDSCMDFAISFINHKILAFADSRPDENHPYGHGKAESITSLGQGALLLGGGLVIIVAAAESALDDLRKGQNLMLGSPFLLAVFFLFAAFLSFLLTRWLEYHGRTNNSPALMADAGHYRGDVLTNFGSAVGISLVAVTGKSWLDPCIAALFALKVTHSGYGLMRSSIDALMDHDVSQKIKSDVESFAKDTIPEIIDIHKFRGRQSGSRFLFDFHVTLPSSLSFFEVHEKVEQLEEAIAAKFNADTVIHADPK